MTKLFSNRDKAFLLACAYLGGLLISCTVLGWSIIVGGNPLTFQSAEIVDDQGRAVTVLHVGQPAGVRRRICSTQNVGVEFFPTLRDAAGLLYPLPSGMIEAEATCGTRTYGFVVPDIPAGEYIYQSTIRFQANLVGRDEMTSSPAVFVRIEP